MCIMPGLSSEVAVEEQNRGEEQECQQSERITGVAPEEGHRVYDLGGRITGLNSSLWSTSVWMLPAKQLLRVVSGEKSK